MVGTLSCLGLALVALLALPALAVAQDKKMDEKKEEKKPERADRR